jgi:hypothetical protein
MPFLVPMEFGIAPLFVPIPENGVSGAWGIAWELTFSRFSIPENGIHAPKFPVPKWLRN